MSIGTRGNVSPTSTELEKSKAFISHQKPLRSGEYCRYPIQWNKCVSENGKALTLMGWNGSGVGTATATRHYILLNRTYLWFMVGSLTNNKLPQNYTQLPINADIFGRPQAVGNSAKLKWAVEKLNRPLREIVWKLEHNIALSIPVRLLTYVRIFFVLSNFD